MKCVFREKTANSGWNSFIGFTICKWEMYTTEKASKMIAWREVSGAATEIATSTWCSTTMWYASHECFKRPTDAGLELSDEEQWWTHALYHHWVSWRMLKSDLHSHELTGGEETSMEGQTRASLNRKMECFRYLQENQKSEYLPLP